MRAIALAILGFAVPLALASQSFSAEKFPGGKDVTVPYELPVYDTPEGKIVGKLEKGRTVAIFECRDDQWCAISGGWVLGLAPAPGGGKGAGGGGGGGGGDQAVAPDGTTVYKEANGDESDANIAGYVQKGGSVTVDSCDGDTGFCKVSAPYQGFVWHEDIGR